MVVDGAVERERGAHGHFDGAFVEYRESAGEAEADGTDVRVRRIAEARRTAAEDFCAGEELDVNLEANDGLVFGDYFRRERRFLWGGFRHKGTKIIASARGSDRLPEGRKEALCQSETAKEEGGIEDVAGERVPEEGDTGDVTGDEAGGGVRKAAEKLPDGEIFVVKNPAATEKRSETDA